MWIAVDAARYNLDMAAAAGLGPYRDVTDVFAAARAATFTGSLTFHLENGEPKRLDILWKLTLGDQVKRWVRLFLGRPPA